jgi:anthranilate phosphoribosyltransferase
MLSISPQLRRLADRARTAGGEPAAWLEADEASRLWGAVLDGAVPELELGALLFALAKGGESTDDLIGLHRALAERSVKWAPDLPRRPVSIPVYGLFEGDAAFAALLAAFLRRFDVPVVLHGPLEARSGPSAASLLRDLGVMPCASLADAERDLREGGIAFVPPAIFSPALADLLSLRSRLGTPLAAHRAALAFDPGGMGALRIAMAAPSASPVRVLPFVRATGGDALFLEWPEGSGPGDFARRPRIARWTGAAEEPYFDAEGAGAAPALPTSPADLVPWIRAIAGRTLPAPQPLVHLAVACLVATGAAADFTQAKAVVALQSGRLAA